ncbi:ATP-binding protein [Herbaspirillum sp. C7C8]|jgi:two-component system OmpR family sensor kinase|uniref:sensor histidine kinase n=1 Tax=Herbaspirillum sp. C7C8 TaxID=2736665 RepID=UPI001F52809A|nr:ATP-binding protein [Herbaspirillum sp. C7C8]MCI1006630.1 two-component sensor histidine kinase [Herbaspirillum sp. C7C8]
MDGLKRRLNESVQLKLSVTLCMAILAVAVVAGVFSFASALDEAHELQDDVLRQIAHLMERQRLSPGSPVPEVSFASSNEESRVIVQHLGYAASKAEVDAEEALPLPSNLTDGLHNLDAAGENFRVLVQTMPGGERIAVAQESDFRDEIARDGALRTVMPFLLLMPVLLLIVADLIRKMFRPIAALSREVDQRQDEQLHPVQTSHFPVEVRPFAVAINRLLGRVEQSMASQRRFVADAAHELRSPMTAISLQAERLAQADMPEQARQRLHALRDGIDRGRNLLNQLLDLAKAQSSVSVVDTPVSVQSVYRRVLEELMPLAESKQIDIGVDGQRDAHLMVSELDLFSLLRNLVDNAVRYTPNGGKVDLSIEFDDKNVALIVEDSGPGIPVIERARIFEAFHRLLGSDQVGSGLGLSIVKAIADRLGASITLGFSDESSQTGLRVVVNIPNQ